jgi:ATP-dependent DNA helicase PIF1
MLTAELLTLLNELAKKIRGNNLPFGGIQLLLFGDLYQLPPVEWQKGYIFESPAFDECIKEVIILDEIIRQKDPVWQGVLNRIRVGKCDAEIEEILGKHIIDDIDELKSMEIRPTIMYCKRANVDKINGDELKKLNSPLIDYKVSTKIDKKSWVDDFEGLNVDDIKKAEEFLDKNSQYQSLLQLAVGAQVMLTKNLDIAAGMVNGSRGIIAGFTADHIPVVKFKTGNISVISHEKWDVDAGDYIISRVQIPLILAWATTIHKSQGQTLDCIAIDIGNNVFESGQVYTALSRVRDLDGLYILDFDPEKIKASKKVADFYKNIYNKLP